VPCWGRVLLLPTGILTCIYLRMCVPACVRVRREKDVRVFLGEVRMEEVLADHGVSRPVHEQLVYNPRAPTYRLAPLSDFPVAMPSNPESRRYARAVWEQEQHDLRRSTRRSDDTAIAAAGGPLTGREAAQASLQVLEALHAASAMQIERSLAGMQQDVRERVETRLVFSAFTKIYAANIVPDRGQATAKQGSRLRCRLQGN